MIILKQTDKIQLTSLKIEDSFLLFTKKSADDMFIYDIDTLGEAWTWPEGWKQKSKSMKICKFKKIPHFPFQRVKNKNFKIVW